MFGCHTWHARDIMAGGMIQGKEAWTSFNVGAKLPSVNNLYDLGLVPEPLWTFVSSLMTGDFGPRWSLRPFPSLIFNPIFDEKSYYCKTRQIFSVGLK